MFQAYNNIGNRLRDLGRWDEAIATYLKAIQLQPQNAVLHFNLGQVLRSADRLPEALVALGKAVQAKSDYAEAHASMAIVLAKLSRFDEAMASYEKVARLLPGAAITHEALGEIHIRNQDGQGAIAEFRRAVTIDPNLITSWTSLGDAYRSVGNFQEAAACFRRIVALRPESALGYANLTGTGRLAADEAEVQRLGALFANPGSTAEDRVAAGFSLGKILDESDRFEEAFARFAEANEMLKRMRAAMNDCFDPAVMRRQIDQQIEVYTRQFFEQRSGWGNPSELPVFVVGMPRSGTTLVQQIVASHPQVYGAGELMDLVEIAKRLGGTDAKSAAMGWTAESIQNGAQQYLRRLAKLKSTATRVRRQDAGQRPSARLDRRPVSPGTGDPLPPGSAR